MSSEGLRITFRAGQVRRYHALPEIATLGQTVADHSWGMLALLYKLNPTPSPNLVKAIAMHDGDEIVGGDMSYTFKLAEPELAAEHDRKAKKMAKLAGIPQPPRLTEEEELWLKLLDRLESHLLVMLYRPDLLSRPEFVNQEMAILDMARRIDLTLPVTIQALFKKGI